MLNILCCDITRYLAYYLDLLSVLQFSQINRQNYYCMDDLFYRYYAIVVFGQDFWIKARQRPIQKSRPLISLKQELIRIELFQKMLDNLNFNRWTKKDFYNYWQYD